MSELKSISHEFASDADLQRQIQLWGSRKLIDLITNAMPVGVLILNEQRQAVYANGQFRQIVDAESPEELLGLRPGNILNCVNADLEEHGCGSSLLCKHCGAMRAIISSLFGQADQEECYLHRKKGLSPLELRVKTTPVTLEGENFTIFAVEDIRVEKERDTLMQTLETMSQTDDLTGLYNRRFLYQQAERELARAIRYRHPVSCFMIDIDHFKQVNDTYGHLIGDEVLIAFSKAVRESLRAVDVIARWGGEEFVALLPESNIEQAHIASERLRQNVADMRVPTEKGPVSITISIGTTGLYGGKRANFDQLIKEADDALYLAKEGGRNRVVHWDYRRVK